MIEGIALFICAVVVAMFSVGAYRLVRMRNLFRYTPLPKLDNPPSISVCIPARNEGHAMTDCLDRVIASTYQKLEIIVLDDQSGDKTPSLIKAYAHDGVRFVEGSALAEGWLGKNHSLAALLEEASGEYVLFMDVDTRLQPDSIDQLVAYAENEHAEMVSVLPRRDDGVRSSTVFSSLRYFWELLFHSKTRPAVASSAWLVRRESLLESGGFNEMRAAIQPEAVLAKYWAGLEKSRYRFLIGTRQLGVAYEKRWQSQRDTSVRLLFPLLGQSILRSMIAVLDLLVLASPVALFFVGVAINSVAVAASSAVVYAIGGIVFWYYFRRVWSRGSLLGAAVWPVLVVQEAIFIIISTMRYRQGRVNWKGRSVRLN